MRYYLEAVCGTRKQVKNSTAFFNTFNLGSNLSSGVYDQVKQFVTNNTWGFYEWLRELSSHEHAMKPYVIESDGNDLRNVLSHKTISGGLLSSNPISDDNISGKINSHTKKTTDTSAKNFFKSLHDVSEGIYGKTKN